MNEKTLSPDLKHFSDMLKNELSLFRGQTESIHASMVRTQLISILDLDSLDTNPVDLMENLYERFQKGFITYDGMGRQVRNAFIFYQKHRSLFYD